MHLVSSDRTVIGWREWAALPELGVERIKVKIDTGARTSALHATSIEPYEKDGERRVRFRLQPGRKESTIMPLRDARVVDTRDVTNSGGQVEKRFVIETDIVLGEQRWSMEVTLTSRDTMKFKMLLGRTAMRGRLLVDPQRSFLTGRR
ncbi:MAG: RimK/LysX family protein [Pseudomonadota bacterium]